MTEPRPFHGVSTSPAPAVPVDAESSLALVHRARDGEEAARNELCARYLPRLRRWAHGRLPASARGALDTADLVQDTFIRVLDRLPAFEPRHAAAFQGYVRRALLNRVCDEVRRVQRRGTAVPLDVEAPGAEPSPLELAIGSETLAVYERALERLSVTDREAIILRIEMGFSYAEIMEAIGKPTIGATQMTVSRALLRLGQEMARERP